jgi:hypothetical protein
MALSCIFTWHAGLQDQRTKSEIEKNVRRTLDKHFNGSVVKSVSVTAVEISGGNHSQPVKLLHSNGQGKFLNGVYVWVHTQGKSQGLKCYLTIPGVEEQALAGVIAKPPLLQAQHPQIEGVTRQISVQNPIVSKRQSICMGASNDSFPPKVSVIPIHEGKREVLSLKKISEKSSEVMTPLARLKKNGISNEEIERLKATFSSIIYEELALQGESEVPNSLQVPVERITHGILEHMHLQKNAKGDYQGIVANFYAAKVSLFACKWEDSRNPDSLYTDWVFDCVLVLDFVGGKDRLKHLAQERKIEVQTVETRRVEKENLPQTVDPLVLALGENTLPDHSILEMVRDILEAREIQQKEVELAEANESYQFEMVDMLEQKLAEARANYENARRLNRVAQDRLKKLMLSEEVAQQVRSVRDRIVALASSLGL